MMHHRLITVEEYPPSVGCPVAVTIETPRGQFAGVADLRGVARAVVRLQPAAAPELVDIWHPVPRWMRPWQVLESLV